MSALDDAYKAAATAADEKGREHGRHLGRYLGEGIARCAIDAFLVNLADNPPDEMVEAAGEAVKAWSDRVTHAHEERLASIMQEALSAAFRSIQGVRA